jgi:hypothetical protein
MIDHVDRTIVEDLAERSDGPWISLQLPTERVGQNPAAKIRYKNLVTEAVSRLKAKGTDRKLLDALTERMTSMLDDAPFWTSLEDGLAVYLSPNDQLVFRLAESFDESVTVSDTPQVDVLLLHADNDRPHAVLALSLKHVRLLRGNRHRLVEDDPPVLPTDIETALAIDDREPQLQSRSVGRVGPGNTTAAFHGHGGTHEVDVERFMRLVDDALNAAVPNDLPIVLAGVDRTVAAFRKVSRHRGLIDESIHGNADRLPAATLHERAWPIVCQAI